MLFLMGRTLFLSAFIIISSPVIAQNAELDSMLSDIVIKQSTPELKERAITAGRDRALLCSQCHGYDGNSKKPEVPNLAQQNPSYLLLQIEKFATGARKNYVMNVLSKNFSREDKVNLALFYANMKLSKIEADPQLAIQGKSLYLQKCSTCHGVKGVGKKDFARLAGQQIQYVENTLKRFRDNANGKITSGSSKRNNPVMESIAKPLTDDNIKALATYIALIQ